MTRPNTSGRTQLKGNMRRFVYPLMYSVVSLALFADRQNLLTLASVVAALSTWFIFASPAKPLITPGVGRMLFLIGCALLIAGIGLFTLWIVRKVAVSD